MKITLITAFCGLLTVASAFADQAKPENQSAVDARPTYDESIFDFGHVGIDYTVLYRYPFVNRTSDTIRLLDVKALCDCSSAGPVDSVLAPGDTTRIHLKFSTKDFYGPQNKIVAITTDHPDIRNIEYYYLAIIGQWFDGIRPDPLSVFMLPTHKSKTVTIPNRNEETLSVGDMYVLDDFYTIDVKKGSAAKGESLELEVIPSPELTQGTYHSNFTLTVDRSENGDPVILTIPIKIVRY